MVQQEKPSATTLCDVVIATRNRPEPLRSTLVSIGQQTTLPSTVIIVDSSDTQDTQEVVELLASMLPYFIRYQKSSIASAAIQRNFGVAMSDAPLICLLDDDVDLDPSFLQEIVPILADDRDERIGGISGTIVNQTYSHPRLLNRCLLRLCTWDFRANWAGKVVGPAVNFLPADVPNTLTDVEWLPTTCTVYRRSIIAKQRFCEEFVGYSFAEDLHLSTRIAKSHRLLNCSRARVYHHDLGGATHKDWKALGKSMVTNRHKIMSEVLERRSVKYHVRLFLYEVVYGSLAWLAGGVGGSRLKRLFALQSGKLAGFWQILGSRWGRDVQGETVKKRLEVR